MTQQLEVAACSEAVEDVVVDQEQGPTPLGLAGALEEAGGLGSDYAHGLFVAGKAEKVFLPQDLAHPVEGEPGEFSGPADRGVAPLVEADRSPEARFRGQGGDAVTERVPEDLTSVGVNPGTDEGLHIGLLLRR